MLFKITSFELYRLELPTGRPIGDCTCDYESLDVLGVCLKTDQGHYGWGFGETVSKGRFTRPAPFIYPMPPLAEIRAQFEGTAWPLLAGQNPYSLKLRRPGLFTQYSFVAQAVRLALWDLMAKAADAPLYRFLGGNAQRNRVRAYGSGLDFPLAEQEAVAIFRKFVQRGFKAVKVKVGHPDPKRDLRRLQAIREAIGESIEIAIDANQAWTCDEAIRRVQFFQREGIRLVYVEDPLAHDDEEGMRRLSAAIDLDLVGHDYFTDPQEVRRLVASKALRRVRVLGEIDYALACADVAREFNVPLICGNSLFELNVHAALALPSVERMEFSDLAWNLLPISPVRFEDGYAMAPTQPGLGLDPDPAMLERFRCLGV